MPGHRIAYLAVAFSLTLATVPPHAGADEPGPSPSPSPSPSGPPLTAGIAPAVTGWHAPIQGLQFEPGAQPVTGEGEDRYMALVTGSFERPGWRLACESTETGARGQFKLEVPLEGGQTLLHCMSKGPDNRVETQDFVVHFQDWARLHPPRPPAPPAPKLYANSIGLGFSALSYSETTTADFSEKGLTFKAAFFRRLGQSRVDWGGSAYVTALAFGSSQSGFDARFLGANLRMGIRLTPDGSSFYAALLGGVYYVTMFTSKTNFGFTHLIGPQIFPVLGYALPGGDTISAYFKFSPIASGFELMSLGNRELAAGASYKTRISENTRVVGSLDFSRISLEVQGVAVSAGSFSLGAGLEW